MASQRASQAQKLARTAYLWIDSICIDQEGNREEKNAQVSMMYKIYRKATEVLVCVGEHEGGSERLMAVIGALSYPLQVISQEGTPWRTRFFWRTFFATLGTSEIEDILVLLENFESRPYFKRLWIVQELFAAGKNKQLVCGPHVLPYQLLRAFLAAFIEGNRELRLDDSHKFPYLSTTCFDLAVRPNMESIFLRFGVQHLCFDPRDRLFGMISFLNTKSSVMPVPPVDYSKSTLDLALDLAPFYDSDQPHRLPKKVFSRGRIVALVDAVAEAGDLLISLIATPASEMNNLLVLRPVSGNTNGYMIAGQGIAFYKFGMNSMGAQRCQCEATHRSQHPRFEMHFSLALSTRELLAYIGQDFIGPDYYHTAFDIDKRLERLAICPIPTLSTSRVLDTRVLRCYANGASENADVSNCGPQTVIRDSNMNDVSELESSDDSTGYGSIGTSSDESVDLGDVSALSMTERLECRGGIMGSLQGISARSRVAQARRDVLIHVRLGRVAIEAFAHHRRYLRLLLKDLVIAHILPCQLHTLYSSKKTIFIATEFEVQVHPG
ncbi:uncharacterized protein MYCFIDRAFT_197585 [Pseudocercospora fijiensis CIRAD86]|uniref:Heterokaryon incompatibility domain-containing protein n=1 Tax=Pseudocercospora fijiensis (strain CIRAD86) TaxID=383855 RepID=M2YXP9_PSEFD|nr:uncharacterized protein MYCFIDRAFT_197585 [Pseudocercospora fijiensis CIRAD86]EME82475.1 hypothetical protein MYCFIDRAFT_197585 [Pseudocercospora fijiensis CIRAD86]